MIEKFVTRFMENKYKVRAVFAKKHPEDYVDVVKTVVTVLYNSKDYDSINPERIHVIDDGDYQGTLLYVIAASGYQPSIYWSVMVEYGSCSGCDTLQAISAYSDNPPTQQQLDDYMQLALHIVQGLKEIDSTDTV